MREPTLLLVFGPRRMGKSSVIAVAVARARRDGAGDGSLVTPPFDTAMGWWQHSPMRHASVLERPPLAAGIVFLLFAPLLVGAHQHEADHDGATQHIEVPHGGHLATVAETSDRIRPTGLELSVEAAPAVATTLDSRITARAGSVTSEDIHHPARAPPGASRSRAPPLLP